MAGRVSPRAKSPPLPVPARRDRAGASSGVFAQQKGYWGREWLKGTEIRSGKEQTPKGVRGTVLWTPPPPAQPGGAVVWKPLAGGGAAPGREAL